MAIPRSIASINPPDTSGRRRHTAESQNPRAVLPLGNQQVGQLRDELTRAVRRVCPPWLASYSEDFVQVGMLRVMEVHRKRSSSRNFSKSYLWMVAHSAVVDEIRRRQRRQEVSLEATVPANFLASGRPGPEQHSAGREVDEAIRGCLSNLIESRRVAVLLHIHGHSVSEIAERMHWKLKRAKNLVYRGLSDLRICLAEKGFRP